MKMGEEFTVFSYEDGQELVKDSYSEVLDSFT